MLLFRFMLSDTSAIKTVPVCFSVVLIPGDASAMDRHNTSIIRSAMIARFLAFVLKYNFLPVIMIKAASTGISASAHGLSNVTPIRIIPPFKQQYCNRQCQQRQRQAEGGFFQGYAGIVFNTGIGADAV